MDGEGVYWFSNESKKQYKVFKTVTDLFWR